MKKAIVVDIEGTITDIDFVHNVLFPYAKKHLPGFISQNAQLPNVKEQLINILSKYLNSSKQEIQAEELDQIISLLQEWMAQDKKITELKALQGIIWEYGYKNKSYTGHLYDDAYKKLCFWKENGHELFVYSSGSVKAQELLFEFSDKGNIKHLFSGFFDTHIGMKQDKNSYHNIQKRIGSPANNIVFFSDVPAELDAAIEAHFCTYLVDRKSVYKNSKYNVINNFSELSEV